VALAAIQGLNQKLEAQLNIKDAEIAELQSRLEKLEQLITGKNGGALFDINRP
jgi:prefoldin subunit 5